MLFANSESRKADGSRVEQFCSQSGSSRISTHNRNTQPSGALAPPLSAPSVYERVPSPGSAQLGGLGAAEYVGLEVVGRVPDAEPTMLSALLRRVEIERGVVIREVMIRRSLLSLPTRLAGTAG